METTSELLFRERLIRIPAVEDLTGFKKSYIYQRIKKSTFPKPLRIGTRAVAWRMGDILDWLDSLSPVN